MSLTGTTLAAACTATDVQLSITSTSSGFPAVGAVANQPMQVDGEMMAIVQVPASGTVIVRRGLDGTASVAHDILANVQTSSNAQDFPTVPFGSLNTRPPYADVVISVGQNGTIPLPTSIRPVTINLTKATALATTTLAAPSIALNGLRLTITSQTAAAHVITATSLIADGVSGSPHTTATWAAFKGASLVLEADAGLWNVISAVGVTIS